MREWVQLGENEVELPDQITEELNEVMVLW